MARDPLAGTRIDGRFTLVRPINDVGGQGQVYIVKVTPSEQESSAVVVKVVLRRFDLPATQADDESSAKRHEARRAVAEMIYPLLLKHPHLLVQHESGACCLNKTEYFYFVLERGSGSLHDEIARLHGEGAAHTGTCKALALEILRSIGSAAYVLNAFGISHRDVKPHNILRVGGEWKLADFGMAKEIGTDSIKGSVAGTPGYLDPLSRNGIWSPTKTDAYSLGCVLHECLTGRLPTYYGHGAETMLEPEALNRNGIVPGPLRNAVEGLLCWTRSSQLTIPQAFALVGEGWPLPSLSETLPGEFSLQRYDLARGGARSLVHEPEPARVLFAKAELPPGYDPSDWTVESSFSDESTWLTSRRVDRLLRRSSLEYRKDSKKFKLPENAVEFGNTTLWDSAYYAKRDKKPPKTNENKIRLATEILPELFESGDGSVLLQRCTYFDGLASGDLTNVVIKDRDSGAVIIDGRSFIVANRKILRIDQSAASSHIGVSTLGITRQGALIIVEQHADSDQSGGKKAPSGSGSSDWEDVTDGKTFEAVLRFGMEREFREESTRRRPGSLVAETAVLGYARLLSRGGKPEFFGLTLMAHSNEVVDTADEYTKKNHKLWATGMRFDGGNDRDLRALAAVLHDVVEEFEHIASAQLLLNARIVLECLEQDPEILSALIDRYRRLL